MYRFLLSRRWIVGHVLLLAVVGTCVLLGLWQLRRLEERRARNAEIEQRLRIPEAALPMALSSGAAAAYRRVVAEGTFDARREVVLRSRSLGGRPGSHLLTPLVSAGGRAIIVDRGWVPLDPPEAWVEARPPSVSVRAEGVLLPPERRGRFGPKEPPAGVLEAVARVDLARLQRQVPYPLEPLYLLLAAQEPAQPGELPVVAPLPSRDEGPHLSYAVQWFTFGVIAVVTYGLLVRREAREPAGAEEPRGRGPRPPAGDNG